MMCRDCRHFDHEYDSVLVFCLEKVLPPGVQTAHAKLTTKYSCGCPNFKPIVAGEDDA